MSWLYFVILASLCWSIVNFMDKFLIDKRVHRPLILTIFIRATSAIPLFLLIMFVGFSFPSADFIGWILLSVLFSSTAIIVYYKAIQMDEISRIIPLFQFTPVFVLILSFLFIGEILGLFDYLGFAVIIAGGLVISAKSLSRLLRVEKFFWVSILSTILYASSYVIMKHVLTNVEYWSAFILMWSLEIILISSLLGMRKVRNTAKSYLKKLDYKDKIFILLDAVISILAFIFYYLAISMGPVTLVGAVRNVRLIFTFLFALFFTKFLPNVFSERFDKRIAIQKVVGMLLIIIGVLLTQLL